MNSDYTHVSILLDRSGSIEKIKSDIIGGYNEFLERQKKAKGKMTLSLSQFDDSYQRTHVFEDIQNAQFLTEENYVLGNTTALLDSAAKLILETGEKLSGMDEKNRPSKVLFTIITDGLENASKEQTKESLKNMIKHQEEKYNWEFIYIGANQDAYTEAQSIGAKGVNFAATAKGTQNLFKNYSDATLRFRSSKEKFEMKED